MTLNGNQFTISPSTHFMYKKSYVTFSILDNTSRCVLLQKLSLGENTYDVIAPPT